MIEAAIAAGDLPRRSVNDCPDGTDRQPLWLWNAVKRQRHPACGLPVERLIITDAPELCGLTGSLGSPANADACWTSVYHGLPGAALPHRPAVGTVNPGVACEAPGFGTRVHTLAPLTMRLA